MGDCVKTPSNHFERYEQIDWIVIGQSNCPLPLAPSSVCTAPGVRSKSSTIYHTEETLMQAC